MIRRAAGPALQCSTPGATLATASHGAATEQSRPERHGALLRQGAAATALPEAVCVLTSSNMVPSSYQKVIICRSIVKVSR